MLKRFGIAIDIVTFAFKGTRVRCFVSGSTDYQMNYSHVHNVLNDHILLCENLTEMKIYIWNWQT